MAREKKVRLVFDVFSDGRVCLKIEGELDPGLLADLIARFTSLSTVKQRVKPEQLTYNPQSSFSTATSIMCKIRFIIENYLPDRWFTSVDVASLYKEVFNESVSLSTVSTYLNRLYRRGFLKREGNRLQWRYLLSKAPNVQEPYSSQRL